MYRLEKNAVEISKRLIDENVGPGQVVLDATVGQGRDSLQLAQKVGPAGQVYGFDLQDLALEKAGQLLADENIKNVKLIRAGHEDLDQYIEENLDFAIYNLGYLPSGDKTIITRKETSLISIEKALDLLRPGGILLVVCYLGHPGGKEEEAGIFQLLRSLDQKYFTVLRQDFINQRNYPPLIYRVEKRDR